MISVSIIVPVYNAEKYLRRCIDSILSQSFEHFELLLVDDGSTDSSGVICDEYATKDNRVRVFHKTNGGVSSARNLGIVKSCGEWVAFVDADDRLLKDALNILMNKSASGTDLVICGYEIYNEDGELIFTTDIEAQEKFININEAITKMFSGLYYNGYLWNKLFNRSVIVNNGLVFHEDIHYNEDRLFCIEYMILLRSKVFYSSEPVYAYLQHADSAISSMNKSFNSKMITEFDAYVMIYKALKGMVGINKQNKKLAKEGVVASYRRLKRMMRRYNCVDNHIMQDRLTHTISLIDYYYILSKFFVRSVRRRIFASVL